MRAPEVDQYRAPFVEPLGHLVLNAAQADMALLELCSIVNGAELGGDDKAQAAAQGIAARVLRNHDAKAKKYLDLTVQKITSEHWRDAASEAIGRLEIARDERHRAIHDAVLIGALGDAEKGYVALPLRAKYELNGEQIISRISPDEVMHLAHRYYVIWKDLELLVDVLSREPKLLPANESQERHLDP